MELGGLHPLASGVAEEPSGRCPRGAEGQGSGGLCFAPCSSLFLPALRERKAAADPSPGGRAAAAPPRALPEGSGLPGGRSVALRRGAAPGVSGPAGVGGCV